MRSLLSFLNVSNSDKLGCDSGVIFHKLIMGNAFKRGWRVSIASPVDIGVEGAKHILFDPGSNKYEVRFRFDWEIIARILKSEAPDVIVVNQIELVEHFRALIVAENLDCKIATYCHYWPVMEFHGGGMAEWDPSLNHSDLAEGILLRILRAFQTSDLFMVTSQYASTLLTQAIARYKIGAQKRSPRIVNCPADPDFLTRVPERNWESNRVLYNSRLYEQYGTSFLVDVIPKLKDLPFEFIVTDFFDKRNEKRARLETSVEFYRAKLDKFPNVHFVSNGDVRSIYREDIVSGSFLNFAPHRRNANWSMGAVDCMGIGVPAIGRRFASFPEFIPEPLLYDNMEECVSLLRRLRNDKSFYLEMCDLVHQEAKKFASSKIADRFFSLMEKNI